MKTIKQLIFLALMLTAVASSAQTMQYSLRKTPFINPHILLMFYQEKATELPLPDAMRGHGDFDFDVNPPYYNWNAPNPVVSLDVPLPELVYHPAKLTFSYMWIGRLKNGIEVLYCHYYSGYGNCSGEHALLFVRLGTVPVYDSSCSGWKIRESIRYLGCENLGSKYRPGGPIRLENNTLHIPKTKGWFKDHPDHTDCCGSPRTITIHPPLAGAFLPYFPKAAESM